MVMVTATTNGTDAPVRPSPPEPPPGGKLAYRAIPDPDWRTAPGARCRWHGPASGGYACGKLASGEKRQPNDPISPWWAYCAEHMRDRWAEGGQILRWELRHADGSPMTAKEAVRVRARQSSKPSDECKAHHCPPSECPPWSAHVHSMRLRNDLWQDMEDATDVRRTTVTGWAVRAMEAALGYVRCGGCPDEAPPVSVVLGDLTGRTLQECIAEAVSAAGSQHPRHEPVTLGTGKPAAAPGVVPFMEPKVARA
jgi:hypothetical protein